MQMIRRSKAAQMLGVSMNTVTLLMACGKLPPGEKRGRVMYLPKQAVEDLKHERDAENKEMRGLISSTKLGNEVNYTGHYICHLGRTGKIPSGRKIRGRMYWSAEESEEVKRILMGSE